MRSASRCRSGGSSGPTSASRRASGAVAKRALDIDSECRGRVRPDALAADPVRSARRAVSRNRRKARKGHGGCRGGEKEPYLPDETCARYRPVLRAMGRSLVGRMARRAVLLSIRNSGALWWFCWLRRRLVRGATSTGQCGLSSAPNRSVLCSCISVSRPNGNSRRSSFDPASLR